jgi:hypothetical protein
VVNKTGFIVIAVVVSGLLFFGGVYLSGRTEENAPKPQPSDASTTSETAKPEPITLLPVTSDVAPVDQVSVTSSPSTSSAKQTPELVLAVSPLATTYITPIVWPPVSRTSTDSYECVETDNQTAETEATTVTMIKGKEWCRTMVSEGAAGSQYVTHTYQTAHGDGSRVVTFTLRAVQCGAYDEPQQSVCVEERAQFNPDAVLADVVERWSW